MYRIFTSLYPPSPPPHPKPDVFIFQCDLLNLEAGYLIRYSVLLRAGWSGDRIQMGAKIFLQVQTDPGAPPGFMCSVM
jgi:hypothetical protein